MLTLEQEVVELYRRAAADLGPTLSGHSLVDLVMDNTVESLDDIREAIRSARSKGSIPQEVR